MPISSARPWPDACKQPAPDWRNSKALPGLQHAHTLLPLAGANLAAPNKCSSGTTNRQPLACIVSISSARLCTCSMISWIVSPPVSIRATCTPEGCVGSRSAAGFSCSKRAFQSLLDRQPASLMLHHLQLRGSDMLAHGPRTPQGQRQPENASCMAHTASTQTPCHTREGMAHAARTGQQLHAQHTCLFSYSISTKGSPLTLRQQGAARALGQQTAAPRAPRRRSSSRGCVCMHATLQPAAPL